jgi:hypothetical protein
MKAAAALVVLGVLLGVPGVSSSAPSVSIVVDASQARHAISPLVYGWSGDAELNSPGSVAGGFSATLAATRPGLIRMGGNRWTAYNWENNYSNAGSDYLYENDDYLSSSTVPGAAVKSTVQATQAQGASTLVTIPIQGT